MRIEAVERLIDLFEQELGTAGAVGELRIVARRYLDRAYHMGLDEGHSNGFIWEWDKNLADDEQFDAFLEAIEAGDKEKAYAQFNVDLNE